MKLKLNLFLLKIINDEVKSYVLEPNTYDIGKYLNLLKIRPYQEINIQLKEGNYTWDENYICFKILK